MSDFVAIACRALGIDRKRLPTDGLDTTPVYGIPVWILPRIGKGKSHRLLAQCPKCGKTMSAGRIKQHAKWSHRLTVEQLNVPAWACTYLPQPERRCYR